MASTTQTEEAYELEPLGHEDQQHSGDASAADSPPAVYPTGYRLFMLTIGLVLTIFLAALDSTIIATAIPSITDELGSVADIAWYGTAYAITNTAFQSAWAKAYGQFTLRATLSTAIAIFEIGNVVCAVAPSANALILGRIVAGLGGAGCMSGAFIIIALTSSARYRAAYMALCGVTFSTASVAGPLLGGALTDGPGWRYCFWVSLPIGGLAAAIMAGFLSQPPHAPVPERTWAEKGKNMDVLGALLVSASLAAFVMAMHWGGAVHPWNSRPVVAALVSSVVAALLFMLNEHLMSDRAMVQTRLLRNKTIRGNLIFMFLLGGVYFPLLYTLPIQFQAINDQTAAQSGIRLIPVVLGVSVFTMISNGLLTYYQGYFNPYMVIGSILGAIGTGMIVRLDSGATTSDWIGYEVLVASGVGLSLQIPMLANQAAVGMADVAAVTALTLFFENMGTTLTVAMSEAVFTNRLVEGVTRLAPTVGPASVINAGATQLRQLFSGAELAGVLTAYVEACQASHVVGLACGIAAVVVASINAGPNFVQRIQKRARRSV